MSELVHLKVDLLGQEGIEEISASHGLVERKGER